MSVHLVAWKGARREYSAEARRITGSLLQTRGSHKSARYSTTVPLLDGLSQKPKAEYAKERLDEREFFLSLLNNSPKKRTTNAYLSRFSLPKKLDLATGSKRPRPRDIINDKGDPASWQPSQAGVNLGNLYVPAKAIEQEPVFAQQPLLEQSASQDTEVIHVALVKLRQPQILDDDTLNGIGLTLSQLVRLGLNIAVVVDFDGDSRLVKAEPIASGWSVDIDNQMERIVSAISEHNKPGALKVKDTLRYSDVEVQVPSKFFVRGRVEVCNRRLLHPLLESGIVPVLPPIACAEELHRHIRVNPDDIMLALTREFAGITSYTTSNGELEETDTTKNFAKSNYTNFCLDRIIVLDPLGGIPSNERPDKAHVFINLAEEYDDVKTELLGYVQVSGSQLGASLVDRMKNNSGLQTVGSISKVDDQDAAHQVGINGSGVQNPIHSDRHIGNLDLVQRTLQLLPPSSSAIIISPSEAAASSQRPEIDEKMSGVRTRRQRNPLIHNLLTDKPMISSSLPLSRFVHPLMNMESPFASENKPTFVKKGIPLTMIPDPRISPWTPPGLEGTTLSLTDPGIDLPRLVHLIEDSFGRKLDVKHYLSRIQNRLAGIIVAGEYEGGAILTWEVPPNFPNSPPVPYLDKFAVLRRAQGTGGVADIVFKALLRQCFPKGCVWRSRSNNPVNKWYFERSAGCWKLPGGQWTMFWSVEEGFGQDEMGPGSNGRSREERWRDWVDVCHGVVPSWADPKAPD